MVFFIFLVSNIGGSLTPLGDPPLFVGFLRGVDFFWTTSHLCLGDAARRRHRALRSSWRSIAIPASSARPGLPKIKDPTPDFKVAPARPGRTCRCSPASSPRSCSPASWRPGVALHRRRAWRSSCRTWCATSSSSCLALAVARHFAQGIPAGQRLHLGTDRRSGEAVPRHLHLHHPGDRHSAGRDGWRARAAGRAGDRSPTAQPNDLAYFWLTGLLSSFLDNAPTYLVFFELAGGDPAAPDDRH